MVSAWQMARTRKDAQGELPFCAELGRRAEGGRAEAEGRALRGFAADVSG